MTKDDEMGWECSTYGGVETCVRAVVGKPEGKRSHRISGRSCKDNIKMCL